MIYREWQDREDAAVDRITQRVLDVCGGFVFGWLAAELMDVARRMGL